MQIYGGSGGQPLFPVPVSVETDPVLNRASWIKPPYVPEIGQPLPITRISIVAGKHSRNGTEVDVPLTITNTGTADASSIEFSQITLRVLDGSGQITLAAPSPATKDRSPFAWRFFDHHVAPDCSLYC